jgi:uncharacterized protein YjiS (DUF1127 family)
MIEFLRDTIARRRTYNRIQHELSQDNHRELYDLGIGWADIDQIAWKGACGAFAADRSGGAPPSCKSRKRFQRIM